MGKNRKKRKGSFLKRNRIALLFLGGLLAYLSITIVNQEIKLRDLQKEETQLQKRADQLKEEVSEMEKKSKESANPEFIEKTAREKLKMVKQNEIIYIIQDEKQSD
ncbi:septum formation initiator family protein [Wukongibacter baidiensis]|uniref:FtsB family cell division protein n=1 Tax=Wukongibacter baidiensis TaxID=1723361 RepID=UPI003D7F5187